MAGASVTIALDNAEVRAALADLLGRLRDPAPALRDIGEYMLRATDERFRREQAPDGTPWAPLRDITLLRRLTAKKGTLSKKQTASGGRTLTQKGAKLLGAARILRDSGDLQDTIRYQLEAGGRAVAIGTDRVYGAAHQFGMPRGYAGQTKRGAPIPWGDIPPRPFLGASEQDGERILEILRDYLGQAAATRR